MKRIAETVRYPMGTQTTPLFCDGVAMVTAETTQVSNDSLVKPEPAFYCQVHCLSHCKLHLGTEFYTLTEFKNKHIYNFSEDIKIIFMKNEVIKRYIQTCKVYRNYYQLQLLHQDLT